MSACCARRKEDGTIDRQEIDNAVAGRAATLSPTEVKLAVFRLSRERQWGLKRIAGQLGYSTTVIAEILAKQKLVGR